MDKIDVDIEFAKLNFNKSADFAEGLRIIREKGEALGNDKWWYRDCFMYMDPADAGWSASIIRYTTVYNGTFRKNDWEIESGPTASVDGKRYTANDYKKTAEDANKREQAAVPTVEVPAYIIDNIIKYCETEAIYDKLGRYGDFYYKLKNLRK